jgi:hypothetical protein
MAGVPFHYVDLRTFSYATEDDAAVERALRTFLPEEPELEGVVTEGHHGDPILVLSVRLENADDVRAVLDRLSALSTAEHDRLLAELDERVDEDCSLFVSFDKQAAARGEVALGEGIQLRAKVEAYPAKQPAAVENAREALEES